ncbi:MAG: hypothetical protein ACW98X_24925 [Promethearchaeota archaeon]
MRRRRMINDTGNTNNARARERGKANAHSARADPTSPARARA